MNTKFLLAIVEYWLSFVNCYKIMYCYITVHDF